MQRYFTDNKDNNTFILSKDDSYHALKVMRLTVNDKIEVVFENNLYICNIVNTNNLVIANIINSSISKSDNFNITVVQSLVKEQKMDLILQKSTELGVTEIIPLETERCLIKSNDKYYKKIDRWKKIVKEASQQSKRLDVPIVSNVLEIDELIKLNYDIKILCSVNEKSVMLNKIINKDIINKRILIVVGPEGGFTDYEEELFTNNGFIRVSLGNNVLRTETVSLYLLSVIGFNYMRW